MPVILNLLILYVCVVFVTEEPRVEILQNEIFHPTPPPDKSKAVKKIPSGQLQHEQAGIYYHIIGILAFID